ncbi:MAG TPA: hypothetical protein PLR06_13165, partial [Cyclobacteriaceae bacterium]|nr:hypothetical protein [Cyclobacteriaceae bacterium]
ADNASNRRDKPLMMQIGLGVRFTSYLATKEFYSSVPEMIMFPGALTYKPDPDPTKKDSVFIPGPQLQCLNLFFNINFELKNWLRAGMNGDIIGYTFGPQRQGLYINGTQAERVTVTPEHFNCFWIEKGDESGMLLVEFFVTIPVADHIELKLAAQVLDMVYLTDRPVQTYPRANDRFRLQSYMWSAGIAYGIGKKSKR